MKPRTTPILTAALMLIASLAAPHAAAAEDTAALHDARQMVLVVTPDWNADHGELHRFARDKDGWHPVGESRPVTIGKTGAGWGIGLMYNRIVRASDVGKAAVKGASEHMRLDLVNDGDQRYRMGFVIEHNPAQKPMAGSCIFAHLWKRADAPTVGCTAMTAATMQSLLVWLKPDDHPVFVLLPREAYERLQPSWQLPKLDDQA